MRRRRAAARLAALAWSFPRQPRKRGANGAGTGAVRSPSPPSARCPPLITCSAVSRLANATPPAESLPLLPAPARPPLLPARHAAQADPGEADGALHRVAAVRGQPRRHQPAGAGRAAERQRDRARALAGHAHCDGGAQEHPAVDQGRPDLRRRVDELERVPRGPAAARGEPGNVPAGHEPPRGRLHARGQHQQQQRR